MAPAALAIVETVRAPTPAGQVFDVPIEKIRIGPRLRELNQVWATALSGIMDAEGQHAPVDLYPIPGTDEFELGPGLHRTAARKIGGHLTVKAFIHPDAPALERRLREVSENLWRLGLPPLDRAAFVNELHQVLRLKAGVEQDAAPQSVAAKARWEKAAKVDADDASLKIGLAYGFGAEIAGQLGLSRATVYQDLQLHRALARDVAEAVRPLALSSNASQLRALSKLPHEDQRKVVAEIAEGRAKGVSDAVKRLTPGATVLSDPQDIAYVRAVAAWSRLSAKNKALLFSDVIQRDPGLPAALRSAFSTLPEVGVDATEMGPVLGQADRGLVGAERADRGAASGRGGLGKSRPTDAGPGSSKRPAQHGRGRETALDAGEPELASAASKSIGERADG